MLSAGADLEVVRDVLGHADVATTSLYLHSSDSRKRDAATKLALD
jgi:site-specific recombinase XerD